MTLSQLCYVGESLTAGGALNPPFSQYSQGGPGCWADVVNDLLCNLFGLGPQVSSGFISGWAQEAGAGWVQVAPTDPFDVAMYGRGKYANGIGNTMSWAKPTWRTPVGVAFYWINYPAGGDWQFSLDNGSTYANMGQVLGGATANKLCKFYVPGAVTTGVKIRAYDGAAGVGCCPVGIEYFWLPPNTAHGWIGHNVGQSATDLHDLVLATSGDRMAFFDSVQLGTGSPIANTPNVGVLLEHINDVKDINTGTLAGDLAVWGADLTTFCGRTQPLGPVGIWNTYENNPATYDQTRQTAYRAQTKTTAAALGVPVPVFDMYDQWAANGWVGYTAANAAGLIHVNDGIHPSQMGHNDIAARLYWFVRNKILGLGAASNSYAEAATKAAVVHKGKLSTVVTAAGVPLVIR